MIKPRIPASFFGDASKLTWCDVRYGLKNDLLDDAAIGTLARARLFDSSGQFELLENLERTPTRATANQLIDALCASEGIDDEEAMTRKWLYIVLAWAYVGRASDPDPLGTVEMIYADFGYPEAMASFVRYMPMTGPDLGSQEANVERLFSRWKRYLDEEADVYGALLQAEVESPSPC